MARGGARPGSGRKAGAATKRTREIADRATAEGVTPLEVMLDAMRFHYAMAQHEIAKAKEVNGEVISADLICEALAAAREAAKDAAPYVHPRLSNIEANVNLSGHEAALDELE